MQLAGSQPIAWILRFAQDDISCQNSSIRVTREHGPPSVPQNPPATYLNPMSMPLRKRLVVFVSIIQSILFLAHILLYQTWIFQLPVGATPGRTSATAILS